MGSLYYYKITNQLNGDVNIAEENSWKNIHKFKNNDASPCTAFALQDEDVVTIGEDGSINMITVQKDEIVRTISKFFKNYLHYKLLHILYYRRSR